MPRMKQRYTRSQNMPDRGMPLPMPHRERVTRALAIETSRTLGKLWNVSPSSVLRAEAGEHMTHEVGGKILLGLDRMDEEARHAGSIATRLLAIVQRGIARVPTEDETLLRLASLLDQSEEHARRGGLDLAGPILDATTRLRACDRTVN